MLRFIRSFTGPKSTPVCFTGSVVLLGSPQHKDANPCHS